MSASEDSLISAELRAWIGRASPLQPVCLGEPLSSRSRIVDITERRGKMGVGIYITQEEEVLDSKQQVVLRRRHTIPLFPEQPAGEKKQESR